MIRHLHASYVIALVAAIGSGSVTPAAEDRAPALAAAQASGPATDKGSEKTRKQRLRVMQTVGCLSSRPNDVWVLTNAAPLEPATTSGQSDAERVALGTRKFRLVGLGIFDPSEHAGHTVRVQGLSVKDAINVTSLQMLGEECMK